MLPAKQLYQWHQTKIACQEKETALQQLDVDYTEKLQRVAVVKAKLTEMPPPKTPDEEIQKLLLEQELWLVEKELAQLQETKHQRASQLQQEIHEAQFQLLDLQRDLDESFLVVYHRVAELKERPIVEVKNKACMGCFRPLSLQKLAEWRRGKGPVCCDECERILV